MKGRPQMAQVPPIRLRSEAMRGDYPRPVAVECVAGGLALPLGSSQPACRLSSEGATRMAEAGPARGAKPLRRARRR